MKPNGYVPRPAKRVMEGVGPVGRNKAERLEKRSKQAGGETARGQEKQRLLTCGAPRRGGPSAGTTRELSDLAWLLLEVREWPRGRRELESEPFVGGHVETELDRREV